MEHLISDIVSIILDILPMPDKRNFIRCNKRFNQIDIVVYEKEFSKKIDDEILFNHRKNNLDPNAQLYEKYVTEILYYGYDNLLLDRYVQNVIVVSNHPRLLQHCAKNNYSVIVKKLFPLCNYEIHTEFLFGALLGAHVDLVQWLRNSGVCWTNRLLFAAGRSGNIYMLSWLYDVDSAYKINSPGYQGAALGEHIDVLKWFVDKEITTGQQVSWCSIACANAVCGGKLETLKWLRENNCPWDSLTCLYAAQRGHLEIIKWAKLNGCSWNEYTCSHAARYGHLDVLIWARLNGCPWDKKTCKYAAKNGHLDILQWARQNGCPWNRNDCIKYTRCQITLDWIQTQDP